MHHPRRTLNMSEAHVVLCDWETAHETNYPHFGRWGEDDAWTEGSHRECFRFRNDQERIADVLSGSLDLNQRVVVFDSRGAPTTTAHPDIIVAAMDLNEAFHAGPQYVPFPTVSVQQETGKPRNITQILSIRSLR